MGLFNLFSSKKTNENNYQRYVSVDFHSHLIPLIDDGSKSIEETIEIITFFQQYGVKKMITTPHISMEYFPNKKEDILLKFEELKKNLSKSDILMELGIGAEYMIDDGFKALLQENSFLTFGQNHLLIELGSFAEHPEFSAHIFDLQSSGYQIILAHPERYSFWHLNKKKYMELKDREVLFQLNLLSLTPVYSTAVMNTANWLIENKMIDFVGSDVHHQSQQHHYRYAINSKQFGKLLATNPIKNDML